MQKAPTHVVSLQDSFTGAGFKTVRQRMAIGANGMGWVLWVATHGTVVVNDNGNISFARQTFCKVGQQLDRDIVTAFLDTVLEAA